MLNNIDFNKGFDPFDPTSTFSHKGKIDARRNISMGLYQYSPIVRQILVFEPKFMNYGLLKYGFLVLGNVFCICIRQFYLLFTHRQTGL